MTKTKLKLSLLFVVLCSLLMGNLALADWSETTLGNDQYYSVRAIECMSSRSLGIPEYWTRRFEHN